MKSVVISKKLLYTLSLVVINKPTNGIFAALSGYTYNCYSNNRRVSLAGAKWDPTSP